MTAFIGVIIPIMWRVSKIEQSSAGQLQEILNLSPRGRGGYLRGLTQACPDRLEAVSRRGVPTVFASGGIDFIVFRPLQSTVPTMLERKYVIHSPSDTRVKANRTEMNDAGGNVAECRGQTTGPATVMSPRRGFSQLNIKCGPLFDPDSQCKLCSLWAEAAAGYSSKKLGLRP